MGKGYETSAIWPGPVEKMNFPNFASLPKTYSKQLFIIMFWLLFWSTVWGSTSNGILRKGFRLCALRLGFGSRVRTLRTPTCHFQHRVRTLGVCALSCAPSKGASPICLLSKGFEFFDGRTFRRHFHVKTRVDSACRKKTNVGFETLGIFLAKWAKGS